MSVPEGIPLMLVFTGIFVFLVLFVACIVLSIIVKDTLIRVCLDADRGRYAVCQMIDLLGRYYSSINQALLAYENHDITLHQRINVRLTRKDAEGNDVSGTINTTLGRLIFNEILPQDLGFVDRTNPETWLDYEISFQTGKKQLVAVLINEIPSEARFQI